MNISEKINLGAIRNYIYINFEWFLLKNLSKFNKRTNKNKCIVMMDSIGDSIAWLNFIVSMLQSDKVQWEIICNVTSYEIFNQLNIFKNIHSVDSKKYQKSLIYRLKINFKLAKNNSYIETYHLAYSRSMMLGDSIVRAVKSNKKYGINGNNLNNTIYLNKLTEKWYTNLINFDEKLTYIGDIQKRLAKVLGIRIINNINYKEIYKSNNAYLKKNKNFILINPGASSKFRRWGSYKFFRIMQYLLKHTDTDTDILICGDIGEVSLGRKLENLIQSDRVHNLVARLSLIEYIHIIGSAKFVICNESSTYHIAKLLNIKSYVILGGGHFQRFVDVNDNFHKAIYSKMNCYGCNWECIYSYKKNTSYPCIDIINSSQLQEIIF